MSRLMTIVACVGLSAVASLSGNAQAEANKVVELRSAELVLHSGAETLLVSLRCPRLRLKGQVVGGELMPQSTTGDLEAGHRLEVTYPPIHVEPAGQIEVQLWIEWFAQENVLRKGMRCRPTGSAAIGVIEEIILDDLDVAGRDVVFNGAAVQSYPAFMPGFFVGVEFPIASTRLENGHLLLAHRPSRRVEPGTWFESRQAVYGLAAPGREQRAFQRYISGHRPSPRGLHLNYNSWWTSPVPYTENDILALMRTFDEKLYKPYGIWLDTFCIDMGWSNSHTLWDIDRHLFPQGFTRIQEYARQMKSNLGLWVSPTGCYAQALDNEWAARQGYETMPWKSGEMTRMCCLGGKRYSEAFRDRLVEMVTRYGVRHIKLDGYILQCPEADHGHEPGVQSSEAVAEGGIAACEAVHKANPDVWLEATCFGWNPSPWWLFYVNSVIGTFGDDSPYGRVPAPAYRESATTARDYFNLQGASRLPVPIAAQEVLGVIHQSGDSFLNDAVITILRGHAFIPLYINPAYMNDGRWKALAGLLTWARDQAAILQETHPLLPASWQGGRQPKFSGEPVMPREAYGYAHWQGQKGLVALRNPWIVPQRYALSLGPASGLQDKVANLTAVSLYPEPRRYGSGLGTGDTLTIPLAPYETVVLSLAPPRAGQEWADASSVLGGHLRVTTQRKELNRVEFDLPAQADGPDWTNLMPDGSSAYRLGLHAGVAVTAARADLLVLLESKQKVAMPWCRIVVNGQETVPAVSDSETGWGASGAGRPEHWQFLRAPLAAGPNEVDLELLASQADATVSVWAWATKEGPADGISRRESALPAPELLSLESVPLMAPAELGVTPSPVVRQKPPCERIDGLYLDYLEPASISQGWGTLQENRSVWGRPLTIAGRTYRRGLGTHAPSRLVFNLDGIYRRFQFAAGADGATTPTVAFEVWVDGQKQWESGVMKQGDPARPGDIPIAGAKRLELVVTDGGNGIMGDHADWADARLVR